MVIVVVIKVGDPLQGSGVMNKNKRAVGACRVYACYVCVHTLDAMDSLTYGFRCYSR